MTLIEQITDQLPVRKSAAQKEAFRKWVLGQMTASGYRARVEESTGGHQNVVAGDPEQAQIVFTAHYDTPGCIGFPNLMIPRNWFVYLLYQFLVVGVLLGIAGVIGVLLGAATGSENVLRFSFFGCYMLLLLFMLYGPANKHNVNDNTSGVATLLQLMAQIQPEDRSKAAFILFDNEEKGCRGSRAYAKEHLQVQHTRLIVNLDCVGVGEHMLVAVPKLAKNIEAYTVLERVLAAEPGRTVHFFSAATTTGNSDFRSFKCGVGVAAYKRVKGVGFITGSIHTARDTQADQENLDFLTRALGKVISQLPEQGD